MDEPKKHQSKDRSRSITEAFIKHETFLKRFISRFLSRPQDIEDVVQDTYLKAYQRREKTADSATKSLSLPRRQKCSVNTIDKKVPTNHELC